MAPKGGKWSHEGPEGGAMRPRRPPKGDQRGAMEPRRVTKGGQVGLNRDHEGSQGKQTGAKRAPRGYDRSQGTDGLTMLSPFDAHPVGHITPDMLSPHMLAWHGLLV